MICVYECHAKTQYIDFVFKLEYILHLLYMLFNDSYTNNVTIS